MKDKPMTFWYFEPLNRHANRVFLVNCPGNEFCGEKMCSDDKPHNLWRCSYIELARFVQEREAFGIRFRSWVQTGPHAKIRPWKLDDEAARKKRALAA